MSRGRIDGNAVTTARDGDEPLEVGGAVLVYPNADKTKRATREQAPKTLEELDALTQLLEPLPAALAGPELHAVAGPHCERCAVRALCPVQPEGEVVTRVADNA